MDLKTFFEQFDTIAEAPGGIQVLRNLILDMAVRGKLVAQAPEDEPASVLQEPIENWKKAKIQEKQFLKSGKIPKLDDKNLPYPIPRNWIWTRIGLLCGSIVPNRDKPKSFSGGYPWITLTNFDDIGIRLLDNHSGKELSKDEVIEYNARIIPSGSVLMSCVGRFGLVAVIDQDVVANQQIHGFVVPPYLSSEYIAYVIKSKVRFLNSASTSTTVSYLNKTKCESIPFPLPPLAEQKRIVAKVDELMEMCDRLEAAQQNRNTLRQSLRASAFDALMNATTDNDLNTAWSFIHQNWLHLSQHPQDVEDIRQTILELAVNGRLSLQNAEDEPVEKLLIAINEERNKLVEEGKLRKVKFSKDNIFSESDFSIPDGWRMVSAQEIFLVVTDGDHQPPPKTDKGVPFLVIGNVSKGNFDFSQTRFVTQEYFDNLDWSRKPEQGDILYTVTGSYGIPLIVDTKQKFCVQRHIAILKTSNYFSKEYLKIALSSSTAKRHAADVATGIAQKTVPLSGLRSLPIPLPPLAEQKRIVAKVDKLMQICDQLEANLQQQQQLAKQLVASAVSHLAI